MQKLIVFTSIIFIVFISCKPEVKTASNDKGYHIYGALEATNSSLVYLLNEQNVKIDSSKVDNNSFLFKGVLIAPKKYSVQIKNQTKTHSILLENNLFNVLLNNDTITVSGGDLNTKLITVNTLINNLNTKKLALLDDFVLGTINSKNLQTSIKFINSEQKKIITDNIVNNANNILSSTLFSSMKTFSLEDLKDIENNTKSINNKSLNTLLSEEITRFQKIADEKLAEEKRIAAVRKAYRKPAILFSGDGLNGELVSLESIIKGKKLILIDFWASWCMPCRALTPRVKAIYNKYKNKGFTILTVSEDKSTEKWRKGIEQDKMLDWHHIFDDYGRISSMYGIRTIPYMVLIDGNGGIVKEKISISELEYQLQELL
jgi:thiol-disulfide isomerase/thioredoxin